MKPGRLQSTDKITVAYLFLSAFLLSAVLFFGHPCGVGAQPEPGIDGNLRLIGTIEGKVFTGAVVGNTKGEQSFYMLHDLLPDGSKIVKVETDNITIKHADGTLYNMYVSRTKSAVNTASSVKAAVRSDPREMNSDGRGPLYKSGIGKKQRDRSKRRLRDGE